MLAPTAQARARALAGAMQRDFALVKHASTSGADSTAPGRTSRRVHLAVSVLKASKIAAGDVLVLRPALAPSALASLKLTNVREARSG